MPTDAGAATCILRASRWPWAPRGGPVDVTVACAGATVVGGGTSTRPESRRSCLPCIGFFLDSRVDSGTGGGKIASSLSDGSESSRELRDASAGSAWEETFALDAVCSASSVRRIQPSLPFWKSCLTVTLLSPTRGFFAGVPGSLLPRTLDVLTRPRGASADRNLSMIARVRECCLIRRSEDVTKKSGISASSDGVDSETTSTS